MRIHPLCVPCLLKRVLYEAELIGSFRDAEAVAEGLRILAEEYDPAKPDVSARIATQVHRRVYDVLGDQDPYRAVKERSNRAVESVLPFARDIVMSSSDSLRSAALASVAGNVLDFGIRGGINTPEEFRESFEKIMDEGFQVDDTGEAFGLLSRGSRVAYLTDNCGEILLDSLVWEVLNQMGVDLTVVVKGLPILTDATMDDVRSLGLEKYGVFLTTGGGFVGLEPLDLPEETEGVLRSADLIISKGMANFEALSEEDFRPILYLMRTKCMPIAEHAQAPLDANVAKLYV